MGVEENEAGGGQRKLCCRQWNMPPAVRLEAQLPSSSFWPHFNTDLVLISWMPAKSNVTASELKESLNFLKSSSPLVPLLLHQPTVSSVFAAKSINNNGSHLSSTYSARHCARGSLYILALDPNKTLKMWSDPHFTDKDTEALKGLQVTEQELEPKFLWVSYHYTLLPRGICHLLKHGFVIIFNLRRTVTL